MVIHEKVGYLDCAGKVSIPKFEQKNFEVSVDYVFIAIGNRIW